MLVHSKAVKDSYRMRELSSTCIANCIFFQILNMVTASAATATLYSTARSGTGMNVAGGCIVNKMWASIINHTIMGHTCFRVHRCSTAAQWANATART